MCVEQLEHFQCRKIFVKLNLNQRISVLTFVSRKRKYCGTFVNRKKCHCYINEQKKKSVSALMGRQMSWLHSF